jgi:type I restriction enzyme, S subunit
MSKDMKKMLVPTLRFPEFREEGEWEEKKLGDLSQIVRGGSPRPIDEYITSDANGLNWLKIADVNKDSKYVTSTKERVLSAALSKTREVNSGDLIMSNSMSFGRPYILKIKSCIHDGWIAVTQIDEQASRDYLYYLILSPTSQEYFVNNAAGSGVQNLNADIIKLLPAPTPKYSEQQKIADCLSSIDELIGAQSQKVEALKTHKNGLMQQLFPADGETIPRLRFPEFRDAGEWEEYQLFKLTTKISDGIHSTPVYDENGKYAFINGNNLVNGKIVIDEKTKRVSLEEFNKHKKTLDTNSILMSINGTIGNLAFFRDEQVILGKSACFINIDSTQADKFFIYNILQTHKVKCVFSSELTGSTIKNLSLRTIKNIKLLVPTLLEQQKIADSLSNIDELINLQSQKLDNLKTHKKGLMQVLFPACDEVGA